MTRISTLLTVSGKDKHRYLPIIDLVGDPTGDGNAGFNKGLTVGAVKNTFDIESSSNAQNPLISPVQRKIVRKRAPRWKLAPLRSTMRKTLDNVCNIYPSAIDSGYVPN